MQKHNKAREISTIQYIILKYNINTHFSSAQIHQIHTHTYRHRNNADGSFPLSLFDPASSNIQYLCPKVWAKVNKVSSKTSHFPSHLLTTRGQKHTDNPHPSLFLSLLEENYMYMRLNYSLPMSKMQWLGEIRWLFRSLKLVMTLKCRVRLRFLIVHWFYVPCVTLFGATILLPYFATFHPSNSLCFSQHPNWHCYNNNCHAIEKRQLTLLPAVWQKLGLSSMFVRMNPLWCVWNMFNRVMR